MRQSEHGVRRSEQEDVATEEARVSTKENRQKKTKRPKKSRIPADDFKQILHANASFYSAFSSLDLHAMEQLWLKDKRCICHFPGSKKLVSHQKIMRSWRHAVEQMEGASRRNWMDPVEVQVEFHTSEKATVFCEERIFSITCTIVDGELRPESELIGRAAATNAFKKQNGKWHIWYHQATLIKDDTIPELESPNTGAIDSLASMRSRSNLNLQPAMTSLTMGTFDVETVVSKASNATDPMIIRRSLCPKLTLNMN